MKKIFSLVILLLVLVSSSYALEMSFDEAKSIIDNKVPCNELTNEQLEVLGDYYMEQMHPGELHERMDALMGGEGSTQLRNIHINMGKTFYCGDTNVMNPSMMNMMMNRGGNIGMMGNYNSFGLWNMYSGLGYFLMVLFWIVLIAIIVWIIFKLSKNPSGPALEILRKRLAKGEISKKEYERLREELR